jgi:hypothetical protein
MRTFGIGFGFGATTEAAPAAPTLAVAVSGTSVIATITGAAGAMHFLEYKGSSHTAWQSGGSRSGDGTITVTGLSYDIPYIFTAYSQIEAGPLSTPAVAVAVTISEAVDNDFDEQVIFESQIFLNTFGVTIVYLPRGGGSRSIKAILDYGGIAAMPGMPAANSGVVTITIANSSITGISSSEFDSGGDKVTIPWPREKAAAQNRNITKIISEDAGMMTLEIR